MRQVWLQARQAFTFKGQDYASGQVFSVVPLEAVQMLAKRRVAIARQPEKTAEQAASQLPQKRRGRTPRVRLAEAQEPPSDIVGVVTPAPDVPEPAAPHVGGEPVTSSWVSDPTPED